MVNALQVRDPLASSNPGDLLESISIVQLEDPVAVPPEELLPCPAAVRSDDPTAVSTADGPLAVTDLAFNYGGIIRTSAGDIGIDLFTQQTPVTVNDFVYLSLCGFYVGTTFHRVIDNFMSQAGDPTASGMVAPATQLLMSLCRNSGTIALEFCRWRMSAFPTRAEVNSSSRRLRSRIWTTGTPCLGTSHQGWRLLLVWKLITQMQPQIPV